MSHELILRLEMPHILNLLVDSMYPNGYSLYNVDCVKQHCLEWSKEQIKLQRGLEVSIPRLSAVIDRSLFVDANANEYLQQVFYRDVLFPQILDNGECEISMCIPDFFQTLELRFR